MITLRKIAAEVKRLESGGDPSQDSQLSEAYLILLARQAANAVLHTRIHERLNTPDDGDRSVPQLMIASYEIDVEGDAPNKRITLPEFQQNLAFNRGLVIAPVDDPTNHFIPRHNPGVSKFLPCAELEEGQNSYWQKGKNVYFDESMDLAKVLVDLLVAAPDSVGIDDALPIYPEMQFEIIAMVRQMIANKPLQDKLLDGNADKGVKTPQ
jgi:hypothetical protein